MRKIEKTYEITPGSIDAISREVREYLAAAGIGREVYLRTGFAIEEALIAVMEGIEEPVSLSVTMTRRLGKPVILMEYKSDRFDPTSARKSDELTDLVLGHLGVTITWSYKFGANRLTFKLPNSKPGFEIVLVGAIVLAALLGAAGTIIPADIRNGIIGYVLDPVSSVFMKLLTALAPVLMFLSIINGFIKGRDGADFSKIGRYIIVRYVAISAIAAAFMTVAMIPAFSFVWDSGPLKISSLNAIGDMLYDLIPGNVVTAFSENNIIQMIIMAVFFGAILSGLGDRVGGLNSLADDLYKVFLSATEIVCSTLPVFVFTSLLSVLWKNGIIIFVKLWKPIAVAAAGQALFLLVYLVIIAFKLHVSPRKIIRKITPSFIVGISTCSSIAAFTKGNEINKKELGIKASYSDLAYPLGISLYEAVFAEFYLCITYYLAQTYQTPVSPVWFVIAGFICLIVSYAAPQVSGGVLICLGVIMTQLNIPGEGLAIAGTLALILDFFSTGAKVASQHLEMILQADHLGMLDREILRR